MAASFIKPRKSRYSTKVFFYYHNGLKKHKRADINNKHSETIKTLYLKGITKEYLQDRINTFKISDKISNKNPRQFGLLLRHWCQSLTPLQSFRYYYHKKFLSTPANNIVTSCVPFSISQSSLTSSNKFVTFIQ